MSLCVGSRSCPGERQEVGGAPLMNDSLSPHCASQAVHCILMHPECEREEREKKNNFSENLVKLLQLMLTQSSCSRSWWVEFGWSFSLNSLTVPW